MVFLPVAVGGSTRLNSSSSAMFGAQPAARPCPVCARRQPALQISAKFREPRACKQQSDQFRRGGQDVGSTEVQISQLSFRVKQLTTHLQANKKDYASQRGLSMILGKRRRLLKYLQAIDRPKYENIIKTLSIRPIKVQAAKGVAIRVTSSGVELAKEADDQPEAAV